MTTNKKQLVVFIIWQNLAEIDAVALISLQNTY